MVCDEVSPCGQKYFYDRLYYKLKESDKHSNECEKLNDLTSSFYFINILKDDHSNQINTT